MIYKRIILQYNETPDDYVANYKCIFSNILPSYLQSFNFKLHNNYLPMNTLFRNYSLDNDTVCYFCSIGPESIFHVFGSCEKLKPLWEIASQTVREMTNINNFDFLKLRVNFYLDFVNVKCKLNQDHLNMLIYFNSIINYSIWKMRNEIKFEFLNFNLDRLVRRIIRSMKARKSVDKNLTENRRVPHIIDLCSMFIMVTKRYIPIDNG